MRCWQLIGFTPEAEKWLDENCNIIVDSYCPHCNKPVGWKKEIIATEHVDSFYGDGPNLNTYRLKDGRIVKEVIQAEPWSSGPCSFLCLELEDGTRIGEWSETDIDIDGRV